MGKRTAGAVSAQDASEIQSVIELGDRLAVAYQLREMKVQRAGDVSDSQLDEWFDEVQSKPYPIRNEFTDRAHDLTQRLKDNGLDCQPIAKAIQAANHYVGWYAKEWFDCRAFLSSIPSKKVVPVANGQARPENAESSKPKQKRGRRWYPEALAELTRDPSQKTATIAKKIGISKSTLGRDQEFKALRSSIARAGIAIPKGSKYKGQIESSNPD